MRGWPQPFSTLFPAGSSASQSGLQEDNGEPYRTQRDWHLTYCTGNINSLTLATSDVVREGVEEELASSRSTLSAQRF